MYLGTPASRKLGGSPRCINIKSTERTYELVFDSDTEARDFVFMLRDAGITPNLDVSIFMYISDI